MEPCVKQQLDHYRQSLRLTRESTAVVRKYLALPADEESSKAELTAQLVGLVKRIAAQNAEGGKVRAEVSRLLRRKQLGNLSVLALAAAKAATVNAVKEYESEVAKLPATPKAVIF
jgi:hypothetical protein